jgi:hypothetical protein
MYRLALLLLLISGCTTCSHAAFHFGTTVHRRRRRRLSATKLPVTFAASATTAAAAAAASLDESVPENPLLLTHKIISNLKYRQLKAELVKQGCADASGTTAQLRNKLREIVFPGEQCAIIDGIEQCGPDISVSFIYLDMQTRLLHLTYLTNF